ncbi:MAG TPA: E3 binding domain-containing protein, partial [Actinotalea sp.]|nr:E3 binding domain-containing protein [Actinotalea sp.]
MPRYQQFLLPDAGEGLTEAEIVEWKVAVGDTVTVNQVIVEIETAKSLVELPCPFDGVVTALLAEEGETVDVGVPIITVDTDPGGAAPPAPETETPQTQQEAPEPATAPAADPVEGSGAVLVGYGVAEQAHGRRRRRVEEQTPGEQTGEPAPADELDAGGRRVLAKPPVRKLAKDLGIDLASLTPTGPGGIVTREDV